MVQGADLLGDGVNVAARLQGAAEPGGICISGSVYDQVLNKLSLSFKPLGDLNYKNLPQPVRTFAIAKVAGLGMLPSPARRRQLANGWRPRPFVLSNPGLCAKGSRSRFANWPEAACTPPAPTEVDLGRDKRWRGTEKWRSFAERSFCRKSCFKEAYETLVCDGTLAEAAHRSPLRQV